MKQLAFAVTLLMFGQFVSLQNSEGKNDTNVEFKHFMSILKECKAKAKDVICAWSPIRGLKQFLNKCFMSLHNYLHPKDDYVILKAEQCKNFTPTRYVPTGDTNESSSAQIINPAYAETIKNAAF